MTQLPQAPSYYLGLINLRGQIISVIDVANRIGVPVERSDEAAIIICNLGSINLAHHVTEDGVDYNKIRRTVKTAVRFLDRVVDINFYPIPQAKGSNHKWRPIGMGAMGLQDVFFKSAYCYLDDSLKKNIRPGSSPIKEGWSYKSS